MENIRKCKKGLKTGFNSLDEYISFEEGTLNLVAARPANGKTTTLLNLLLNQIELYPEYFFPFFAYEGTSYSIVTKIINILGSYEFKNSKKNTIEIKNYLKNINNKKIEAIEIALLKYKKYIEENRLRIFSIPYEIKELSEKTEELFSEASNLEMKIGGVYIDYIQKIKNKSKNFQSRQLELQNTSANLLEIANKLQIPIILGAQLGRSEVTKVKLDNIRESGDFELDASVVLGVYDPDQEEKKKNSDLKINILKNREGEINEEGFDFEYKRSISKIINKSFQEETMNKSSSYKTNNQKRKLTKRVYKSPSA